MVLLVLILSSIVFGRDAEAHHDPSGQTSRGEQGDPQPALLHHHPDAGEQRRQRDPGAELSKGHPKDEGEDDGRPGVCRDGQEGWGQRDTRPCGEVLPGSEFRPVSPSFLFYLILLID